MLGRTKYFSTLVLNPSAQTMISIQRPHFTVNGALYQILYTAVQCGKHLWQSLNVTVNIHIYIMCIADTQQPCNENIFHLKNNTYITAMMNTFGGTAWHEQVQIVRKCSTVLVTQLTTVTVFVTQLTTVTVFVTQLTTVTIFVTQLTVVTVTQKPWNEYTGPQIS